MSIRAIRKGLGLFIVDIAIIIGIFVLQFRTDSNIIEKIGNLQISLEKADEATIRAQKESTLSETVLEENVDSPTDVLPVIEDNSIKLQNKLQINYSGINFAINDQNSAKAYFTGKEEPEDVKLLSYSRTDMSITFNFAQNIALLFEVSSLEPDATLSVTAILPDEVEAFNIPYSYGYNTSVLQNDETYVTLADNDISWNFTSTRTEDGYVSFTKDNSLAHYAVQEKIQKFTLENLTELASADPLNYKNLVDGFKANLISTFKNEFSDNNFNEKSVVAYVAAQAELGNFKSAIDEIPQDYKKSSSRTYLSAPYFNNLSKMNTTLDTAYNEDIEILIKASASASLDIFTTENFAAHLCIYPDRVSARKILENALYADFSTCTIAQITGIMKAYVELSSINPEYAMILEPLMEPAVQKITDACKFEAGILTISENDTFLSVIQAVETGAALLRYGELTDNNIYKRAGRVIISTYMSGNSSFDLRTLSNLYPIIAYNNWYYPHLEIMQASPTTYAWAWTCAQSIKYEKDSEGTLTLTIDFPEGLTHYVIFKGIPTFESIYIYNIPFRTDSRFETYNSSGYVYKSDSNTLLLKSRHKSKLETIRLTKAGNWEPKLSSSAKASSTTATSTTSKTTAASTPASTSSTAKSSGSTSASNSSANKTSGSTSASNSKTSASTGSSTSSSGNSSSSSKSNASASNSSGSSASSSKGSSSTSTSSSSSSGSKSGTSTSSSTSSSSSGKNSNDKGTSSGSSSNTTASSSSSGNKSSSSTSSTSSTSSKSTSSASTASSSSGSKSAASTTSTSTASASKPKETESAAPKTESKPAAVANEKPAETKSSTPTASNPPAKTEEKTPAEPAKPAETPVVKTEEPKKVEPKAAEPRKYAIVLSSAPEDITELKNILVEVTGNLAYANQETLSLPSTIKASVTEEEADVIISKIKGAGGTAEKK